MLVLAINPQILVTLLISGGLLLILLLVIIQSNIKRRNYKVAINRMKKDREKLIDGL